MTTTASNKSPYEVNWTDLDSARAAHLAWWEGVEDKDMVQFSDQCWHEMASAIIGPRPCHKSFTSRPVRPDRKRIGLVGFKAWYAEDRCAAAAQAEWDRVEAAGAAWDRRVWGG